MKKTFLVLAIAALFFNYQTIDAQTPKGQIIQVGINLNEVTNDQVLVTVNAPKSNSDEITYRIPKTVPGTYSEDNYGKYIENLKAYDKKGNLLTVKKTE